MRRAKRFLPMILVVLILGLTFTACDEDEGFSFSYERSNAYTVAGSGSVPAQFDSLEIDWINGAVIVEQGAADTQVEFYEVTNSGEINSDTTMRYLMDGLTLRIKFAKSGRVPSKVSKNLYVRVPSGFKLPDIDIETVNAAVSVRDIDVNSVECESRTGAIDIRCKATGIEAENVSGAINIESEAYSVETKNRSGQTTVSCRSTPRKLDISTYSGDVALRIKGDIGFKLDFETMNGFLVNAFSEKTMKQGKYYVYLNGVCEYDVDSFTGILTIEQLA